MSICCMLRQPGQLYSTYQTASTIDYAAQLFVDMGFTGANTSISFVIANAGLNFIATYVAFTVFAIVALISRELTHRFPALYLIEKAGRRTLLVFGGIGITLSHIMITVLLKVSEVDPAAAW